MRRLISKIITVGLLMAIISSPARADKPAEQTQPTDSAAVSNYKMRLKKRQLTWQKLMPEMFTLQYAGGIGMFSAGAGWDYGHARQWETHLLLGFLPKRNNYHHYWTFTLRQYYVPWTVKLNKSLAIRLLAVNLSVNSILHKDFWVSEPDRYPSGYYGFSSRIRFHLGVGQRFCYKIPEHRRFLSQEVSIYYEVSTCDLYVRQKFLNKSIAFKDIITLGVGVIYKI